MLITLFLKLFLISIIQSPVSIFNGSDLEGWKVYGTELWYVSDGDLVCENVLDNEYGYLSTDEYYDDFILTLEYKQ